MTIQELEKKYFGEIDFLDLELLIAHTLKRPREFVLAHPEYKLSQSQRLKTESLIARRVKDEPLAYVLGQKEFFGLNLMVNRHTLIPRPETEIMVEKLLEADSKNALILDIGTGSGNIIISAAKNLKGKNRFLAIDISPEALKIANLNAKLHQVNKKIKFIKGNLLQPILKSKNQKLKTKRLIVLANLPYLSKEIYSSAPITVKKFEPKSALHSPKFGLAHYEKLLQQIKLLAAIYKLQITSFLEISPEQKVPLQQMVKDILPDYKISFFKDLTGRTRVAKIRS